MKKISQDEIEKIASKYKIGVSIISEIIDKWEYYDNYLHDSFEAFKKLPFLKRDELPWSIEPVEWAKLSLFYYTHKEEISLREPYIFKKSVFIYGPQKTDNLEFSALITNQIFKVYLEKMANENLLFDQQKAEEINIYAKKQYKGRGFDDSITRRDELIRIAAFHLKSKKIKRYTPVINDLLFGAGFDKVNLGYIRKIIGLS